jgi:3-oxoadipate enol-lactonase
VTLDLNYRIEGTGKRLCLLHPVGLDLTCFDALTAELVSGFQVLRVDLRGHGESPRAQDNASPTLVDFAADVHSLLIKLNFVPTAVAGFSFGGMIAQELAINYPMDINALIVSACGCTFSEETRNALRDRGIAAERAGMASVIESTMERWFSHAFRAGGLDASTRQRLLADDVEAWKQSWNAIAELETERRVAEVRAPTLCLAAGKDLSTPPAVVKRVADAIRGSTLEVIENQPHMLFIEAPMEVAIAIRRFLRRVLV